MATKPQNADLDDVVTRHMHQDYTSLRAEQTVGEALAWLRAHPPRGRVIYFYVVDAEGRLQGIVPTRRLVLHAPEANVADIMIRHLITVPAHATVLDACEFFVLHRLLAFPVVDDAGRLLGVVDIDLYTNEFERLSDLAPALRWLRPLQRFLHVEAAGGIVLLACTVAALILANSPWAEPFADLWQMRVGFDFGVFALHKPLLLWINDGLMTLFFFVVGLEIKRQFVSGELSEWRKAALPIVAALGGMIAPASIYLTLQWGTPSARGWGVPTATDIAFVVGFLSLFGPRVPIGLKVLILSLAIADDIGAILIIALGYNANLAATPLLLGCVGLAAVPVLRALGVRSLLTYVVLGAWIWLAFLKSGVHPTVAGVALGLLTPARPWLGDPAPLDVVSDLFARFAGLNPAPSDTVASVVREREFVSVAERLEHTLHPWVAFAIMPLFALANAGVTFEFSALAQPVALAVSAGLVVGKPLGIVLFSLASLRLGLKLPAGVNRWSLIGAGCLAGIGFTMSLFIASLAFAGTHLGEAKIGILAGSALSAALGSIMLWRFLPAASAR